MSYYCGYIDSKCKYCEEGHCDFPVMGSGYPYDAPCFGYNEEEEDGEWIPVLINAQMLKCSECGFGVNKESVYDHTSPDPLVFKYCPSCGKKMKG